VGGHEKTVQLLIERGADVNAQGGRYGNALQAASLGGHEKIVQILIKREADVNAQGGDYVNALQAASAGGHEKIVQILIERGADIKLKKDGMAMLSRRHYQVVTRRLCRY
jgi:ankyrin repeat domain-containing protein 50